MKFPVTNTCTECFSENLDIPTKKNADTMIKCNDCGNEERWAKIVTLALVRTRKTASYHFQQRLEQAHKQEDEIINKKDK